MSESIESKDFEYFQGVIRDLAGISLSERKISLVQARLRSRIHEMGMRSFGEYRAFLERQAPDSPAWQQLVNLLTTNKTEWFREPNHFSFLIDQLIPIWRSRGKEKISVWSAACSTGEEPYTLAMILRRHLGDAIDFEIVATDIDTDVLQTAQNGVYPAAHLVQVPKDYRDGSFLVGTGEIAEWVKIHPDLRSKIHFQQLNLHHHPFPWKERFDLILCRNVMIYFSRQDNRALVSALYSAAQENASLMIGHSEGIQDYQSGWKFIQPSIFVK